MNFSEITKNEFENRAKKFHKISYNYLIETYLKKNHFEIYEKLYKFKKKDGSYIRLPFIDLSERQEKVIFEELDNSKKKEKHNNKFIKWQQEELGKTLYDKPTFTISSIAGSQITAGIGSYYSTISTSDIHYFRLVSILGKDSFTSIENLSKKEKKDINSWINLLKTIIFEKRFTDYHASIGMSVFTLVKDSNKNYMYLIKSNSSKKSSSAFERHVIPSFMFQPLTSTADSQKQELSPYINVKRETGEELLNMEELEKSNQEITFETLKIFFKEEQTLVDAFNLVKKNECPLEQTGFMIDIFRMRPELTYCLIFTKAFSERDIVISWETENITYVNLESESSFHDLIEDEIEPLCASGLASVIYGRHHALKALKYELKQKSL